jgi:cytochrome c peroxidase
MLKRPVQKLVGYSAVLTFVWLLTGSCSSNDKKQPAENIRHLLPAYIKDSIYLLPENPYTAAKATVGRYFFYDRRLSLNQTKACASCHAPAFSFTDSYRRSIGALGGNVQRNAPALINLIFNKYLTAADSSLHFPEQQISNPLFHRQPVEMGWAGNEKMILDRMRSGSFYQQALRRAFPDSANVFTGKNIQDCISSFVKTIISLNSPYDRYTFKNDSSALSPAQLRGKQLFFSPALHCTSCHGGISFSTPAWRIGEANPEYYYNTGLYNTDGRGGYPVSDQGLFAVTQQPADMGRFRVPTLRNLAFTAPYMHDGSVADLEEVIDIYAAGGRNIVSGASAGNGRINPLKHPLMTGFSISPQQKKELLSFLLCLSDTGFVSSPALANPFVTDETSQ